MGTKLFNILSTIIARLSGMDRRKLLWVNPNPSASFPSQTIQCDMSYDAYEIHFAVYTGRSEGNINQMEVLTNTSTTLHGHLGVSGRESGALWTAKRVVSKAQDGLLFDAPYAVSGTGNWFQYTSNIACTPMKIYGIKYGDQI